MKTIKRELGIHKVKEGLGNISYYLFNEYEVHYNEQLPQTTQEWHAHKKTWETLFIIKGNLIVKWKEGHEQKEQTVSQGDLIEVGNSMHTFVNESCDVAKFIVFKQVLSGAA